MTSPKIMLYTVANANGQRTREAVESSSDVSEISDPLQVEKREKKRKKNTQNNARQVSQIQVCLHPFPCPTVSVLLPWDNQIFFLFASEDRCQPPPFPDHELRIKSVCAEFLIQEWKGCKHKIHAAQYHDVWPLYHERCSLVGFSSFSGPLKAFQVPQPYCPYQHRVSEHHGVRQ